MMRLNFLALWLKADFIREGMLMVDEDEDGDKEVGDEGEYRLVHATKRGFTGVAQSDH